MSAFPKGGTGMTSVLGIFAAVLQALGWSSYILLFLRRQIRPNAASSFMFAYGTALMVLLETGSEASWQILALPTTCAVFSIIVAAMCLRKGATEAVDRVEATAFSADVWLTLLWVAIAIGYGDIKPFSAGFVIAGNITTITCMFPVLRSTWRSPDREQPLPWLIWTLAYATLTVTTLLADQLRHPELLVYPVLNVTLHGAVGLISLRRSGPAARHHDGTGPIYVGDSVIHGKGMFTTHRIEPGVAVCTLTGKAIFGAITESGPNYIGLGPDVWIDPDWPLDHINHHCHPNSAFGPRRRLYALRAIQPGEEVTIDYSTTEADAHWWMECGCDAPDCRKHLYAIQRSFADDDEPPAASPMMQLVWKKRRYEFAKVGALQDKSLPLLQPFDWRKVLAWSSVRAKAGARQTFAGQRRGPTNSRNRYGGT